MRDHRVIYLIGLFLLIQGCKTSSVTSSSSDGYYENLSIHRPVLEDTTNSLKEPVKQVSSVSTTPGIEHELSIKNELDSINKMIIQRNSERKYVDGYTIQVYTGNDDQAGNRAKEHVELMFPALEPIISYRQPTFTVKVGSYQSRLEAHKVFESLKQDFPLAVLIPVRIEIIHE